MMEQRAVAGRDDMRSMSCPSLMCEMIFEAGRLFLIGSNEMEKVNAEIPLKFIPFNLVEVIIANSSCSN